MIPKLPGVTVCVTVRVCDSVDVEMSEDDSLATLVADLDDSFWDTTLTPDNSPRKPIKSSPLSPLGDDVGVKHSNILLDSHSRFKPLDHTRCTVESIHELHAKGRYQKARILSMFSPSSF